MERSSFILSFSFLFDRWKVGTFAPFPPPSLSKLPLYVLCKCTKVKTSYYLRDFDGQWQAFVTNVTLTIFWEKKVYCDLHSMAYDNIKAVFFLVILETIVTFVYNFYQGWLQCSDLFRMLFTLIRKYHCGEASSFRSDSTFE